LIVKLGDGVGNHETGFRQFGWSGNFAEFDVKISG
jgi:hypothetical protein